MVDRILLIGTSCWEATLHRHWQVVRADSGKRARELTDQNFKLIIVDAASMYTTGERICRDLKARFPASMMIHIRANQPAGGDQVAEITLKSPLTARHLTGVVSRILSNNPLDTVSCGPFLMNRTTRILQAHGKQVQLNPKLAALIEFFLLHPNEILPRARIMQTVWKTDYLGDTRTLNVHIRHARRVLEQNPQDPKHLKTIRGTGYRLEISAEKAKSRQLVPDSDPSNTA